MGLDLIVMLLQIESVIMARDFDVILIIDVGKDGPVAIVMNCSSIWIVLIAASCFED